MCIYIMYVHMYALYVHPYIYVYPCMYNVYMYVRMLIIGQMH